MPIHDPESLHDSMGNNLVQAVHPRVLKPNGIRKFWSALTTKRPSGIKSFESYGALRHSFITARVQVLTLLILLANPMFISADFLLYRDHVRSLLLIRSVMEIGLILNVIMLRASTSALIAKAAMFLVIVIPGLCIAQMTSVVGGFSSVYYQGLNLNFLAAAVIIPAIWPIHVAAQFTAITYYYASNFLVSPSGSVLSAAGANSFFIFWSSACTLVAVIFYERLQRAEFSGRRALEVSNKKLLELDKIKSEFFANISHELRTPLSLILGAFKSLKGVVPQGDYQEVLESGSRNSTRLLYVINELLDLAKFDSGRLELRKQCIDIASLVRGVAASFQSSKGKRIHLRGLHQPVPFQADPRQIKKVLYNLLSNAFKFSDPQEGEVWIKLSEQADSVQLEFEDNGIGIPREHLGRIFDRFTQVDSSATRGFEGSGIGLALVKEIVTLHGGCVSVESEAGEGSTFTITLPRGPARSEEVASIEDEESGDLFNYQEEQHAVPARVVTLSASTCGSRRVLVADDNADMRRYLERVLRKEYSIFLAKDGLEALEQAKAVRPDLILTDVMMPRMGGNDLLKAIREDAALAATPVIFLTARAGTEARVESLEAGADDYIAKPFEDNEVLARIRNVIRVRQAEKELVQLQKEKLSRFLPAHISDLILSGTAEDFLKGHRTEITVVFIDLRGFTAFAESAEPEDTIGLLREYQAEIGRVVTEHQGTLERFTGDGVMVFFNDPLPVLNHPVQAARMAVALHSRTRVLLERWKQRGYELGAGIGIAAGYATLGVVGFEDRNDYAAIGSVTNLAARLCGEAQDGQILVSERFLQLVSEKVHSSAVGNMTLKGFRNAVAVHTISACRE